MLVGNLIVGIIITYEVRNVNNKGSRLRAFEFRREITGELLG
jgi:hypothetical protein